MWSATDTGCADFAEYHFTVARVGDQLLFHAPLPFTPVLGALNGPYRQYAER